MEVFNAVTLGDLNIDLVVEAMDVPFGDTLISGCFFKEIKTLVGGNGVFFAEAAHHAGFSQSYLLGTVGYDETRREPDVAAQLIISRLKKGGITPLLSWDKRGTGKVIILYQPGDRRIMFADRGANVGFVFDNLPDNAEKNILAASVFHVSGYSLLRTEQRDTVKYLMRLATDAGVLTSVDIVPHDLYLRHTFEEVSESLEFAKAICVEASTIMGLLKLEQSWTQNREIVLTHLTQAFEYCLIRINNHSDFVVATESEIVDFTIPYQQDITSLRFTDTVYSSAILHYLRNGKKMGGISEFVSSTVALL